MIINELLLEKYRTQEFLDNLAEHDLNKYVSNAHATVETMATELGLKLIYSNPPETDYNR